MDGQYWWRPRSVWRYAGSLLLATLLLAAGFVASPAPQADSAPQTLPRYTVTDLGVLPGGGESEAHAINNLGQVVGSATVDANGLPHAFLWSTGVITDLGTLPGERNSSTATSINDAGEIAGTGSRFSGGFGYAVRWSNGVVTDLGTLGGRLSFANGIDRAGHVVGGSEIQGSRTTHPFVWASGVFTDLGLLAGQSPAVANDINDAGQVVGGAGHAFLWQTGVLTDLGSLPGGTTSEARAINNHSQIVGASSAGADGSVRAALWQNGTVLNLGTLDQISYSVANDINDAGEVVGAADPRCTPCPSARAFLWENGVIQPLNTLIPADSGWVLQMATGINDAGQIAGFGQINGAKHAFLLTPVPLTSVCAPAPLGAAGNFNLFSLGNLNQVGGTAEGGAAVGGRAVLASYQLGTRLPADGTAMALVVGGDLLYVYGGVPHGNIVYGGNLTISNVLLGEGTIRHGTPLDFGAAQQYLLQASVGWAARAANGTTTLTQASTVSATLTLAGADPTLNIFAVASADLAQAHSLTIHVPAGSSVLINISGTNSRIVHLQTNLDGASAQRVLYNFSAASTLDLNDTIIKGSILAPAATIRFDSGQVDGSLIGAAIDSAGNLGLQEFLGCLPAFSPQLAPLSPGGAPRLQTFLPALLGRASS